MSAFNELDITCEECGEEYHGTVWTAIHAGEDPELRDLLLGGELNILICPKCSHPAYQEHFILYQDPAAELLVYIYPPSQEAEKDFLEKTMMINFREVLKLQRIENRPSYKPMIIFGLETFVEMMQEEKLRAEQSQIAEAICREKRIPYQVLRPSEARRLKTVRVIPGKSRAEADVQQGIGELLQVDPELDLYGRLSEGIAARTTRLTEN